MIVVKTANSAFLLLQVLISMEVLMKKCTPAEIHTEELLKKRERLTVISLKFFSIFLSNDSIERNWFFKPDRTISFLWIFI